MSSVVANRELFWSKVAETKTMYSPESAVVFQGAIFAEKAKNLRTKMFRECYAVDRFAERLFSTPPPKVLDLGAGIGANTRPMAKAGAHVTAIDQSKKLLKIFSKKSAAIGCPSENLRLRCGDITTMKSYGGPFDLVVAVDILPYVPPTMLRSTMEKIQQCLDDHGTLIGTIFTTADDVFGVHEIIAQLGAHFYENSDKFVTQLLEYSGFTVLEIEARSIGGWRFKAEKIPVEKK